MGVKSGKRTKADLEREIAELRARVAQQDKVIVELLTRPAVQYVPMPYPAPPYTVGGPTWQIPGTVIPVPSLPGAAPNTYPQFTCTADPVNYNATGATLHNGAAALPIGYGVSVQ